MIETFEEARAAVHREMSLLVDDPDSLCIFDIGLADTDGWLVQWGVASILEDGRMHYAPPLPKAATFVDRLTGFVSLTSLEAEFDRITNMQPVRVE